MKQQQSKGSFGRLPINTQSPSVGQIDPVRNKESPNVRPFKDYTEKGESSAPSRQFFANPQPGVPDSNLVHRKNMAKIAPPNSFNNQNRKSPPVDTLS